MQHDHLIWETIQKACAFKRKFSDRLFCRNAYNVTGLCNRASCPLANSRYATIREEQARCYLYVKTVERAHTPNKMWVKIKYTGCQLKYGSAVVCRLSKHYQKALKQIDSELEYWPDVTIHKNKQRLTKIFQYLLRIKKLSALPRPKIVPLQRNVEKVDRKREARAETVARIENAIEDELIKRLQTGTYGDIYNFPLEQYNKTLEREVKKAREVDLNADEFEEAYESEELESENEQEVEYLEEVDFEESDDDIEDMEAVTEQPPSTSEPESENSEEEQEPEHKPQKRAAKRPLPKKKRKEPKIELEMEEEFTPISQLQR